VTSTFSRYRELIGVGLDEQRLFAWTRAAVLTVLSLFLAAGALVAVTIPFHVWDALGYGAWSRRVAETGNLHFPGLGALEYERPFYYVLQGWVWRIIGFDERTGRVLALAFAVVLVVCVARLATVAARSAWAGILAILSLLLLPDLSKYGISGLNDVPVAALVALAGLLAWRAQAGRLGIGLLVLVSAAAALTKPSALFALAGLGTAQLVGERRRLRARLLRRAAPIAAGCALALVWDELQARRLHLTLPDFLSAGTTDNFYGAVADSVRRQVGFGLEWLGPDLRLLLAFSLLYALARTVGIAHRRAVLVSLPLAVLASWLGPWIAGHEQTIVAGPLTGPGRYVPFVIVAGLLLLAADAAPEVVPSRTTLARLLLWSGPPLAMWLVYVPFDSRYLSPAWPGLVVLCATVTATAVRAGAWRNAALPATLLAVLVVIAARNLEQVDDLGVSGWRDFRSAGVAGWFDQERMRRLVLGTFADEVALTRTRLRDPSDRVFSSDARLKFYFPGRVTQAYPSGCSELRGYSVFVLLLDTRSAGYLEQQVGRSADPAFWASCSRPRLRLVGQRTAKFAVFAVGGSR
jgi:4-amino-4-deoxy-L-arabinose transferase-like glycosyltransferase